MNPEFRKLWAGQGVSAVGSQVTLVALPLTAVFALGATPEQMGLLTAAGWLPYLLFALFAGAWADRLRRKPVLIATDLARAAILLTIPVAALLQVLTIGHVLVVAFIAGAMTVLFQAAYRPFIPVLVGRDVLVEANARLALNESVARVAGPSLGGVLVQVVTAPIAILADALSFVVSAIAVAAIRVTESPPPRAERRGLWTEISEGITFAIHHRFMRPVMVLSTLFNVAITLGDAVFVLYATRILGLDGAMWGGLLTIGGLASVLAATVVQRVTARFGVGPSVVGGLLLLTLGGILVLAATGPPLVAATYLAARATLVGFSAALINVTIGSVTQAVVPDRLQGRVGGAGQVVGLGLIPVSAVLGGWLGAHIGLWNTLAISAGAQFAAFVYVASSPLRTIRATSDVAPPASDVSVLD